MTFTLKSHPEFVRASGDCLCPVCGKEYRRHPYAEEWPGYDDHLYLNRLCDGTLVKL